MEDNRFCQRYGVQLFITPFPEMRRTTYDEMNRWVRALRSNDRYAVATAEALGLTIRKLSWMRTQAKFRIICKALDDVSDSLKRITLQSEIFGRSSWNVETIRLFDDITNDRSEK